MNRRRTLVAALVLLALAFVTLDFRETGGPVGAVQRGADIVFAPVQQGFAALVRPVGNVFGSILDLGTLRRQIDQLQEENAALRQQGLRIADVERRLAEAEGLLNMVRQEQLVVVGGRVIAAPPGTFQREVLIDVGARQGVAQGMAVINDRGVVGQVIEVTATRARVALLTSVETGDFSVNAVTPDFRSPGLLSGQGSQLLRLEMLDSNVVVPLEATVVTLRFQGSNIPAGLPIGVIEPPEDGDTEGERFLSVRPFVDFSDLSTVAVVIAGTEEDGEFTPSETIEAELAPAPTVTLAPDPDAVAVPGLDFPAPAGLAPSEGGPTEGGPSEGAVGEGETSEGAVVEGGAGAPAGSP